MKKILLSLLVVISTFTSFSQDNANVKGLKLKFLLTDLCYEMYQINVESMGYFTEENYAKFNCIEHYRWAKDTYNDIPEVEKKNLEIIMTAIHPWNVLQNTAQLNDSSDFKTVLKVTVSSSKNKGYKKACKQFYPFIYNSFIKDYLAKNIQRYDLQAQKMNEEIKKDSFNIFDFMESESGIKFSKKTTPVFYYTMRPIGAMGFDTKDEKISLIQTNIDNYKNLFGSPFHEFSHELFKTFIRDSNFVRVSELMKNDSLFVSKFNIIGKNNYDWIGWCEENIVEGFSNYLFYKFDGRYPKSGIYAYDLDFSNYLINSNFNSKEISLEQACINFYLQFTKGGEEE